MAIRLPYLNNQKEGDPLRECIRKAVDEMGVDDFTVCRIMTYFMEELSNQVARGRIVRISGFGVFGSRLSKPKTCHNDRSKQTIPTPYPTFSPSKASA